MPRFRDEFEFAGSIAMLPLHQVTLPTVRLDWSLFILMCWSWQRFWSFLCIFAAKHWCLLVMRFGWRFWIIFTSNFFKLAVFFATLCNSRFQIQGDFCKCSYSLHLDNVSLHFNQQALNLDTCWLVACFFSFLSFIYCFSSVMIIKTHMGSRGWSRFHLCEGCLSTVIWWLISIFWCFLLYHNYF